jgi:hypothetical protein
MMANCVYWQVILVEKTGVPGENYQPIASHWQTWSHNAVLSTLHVSGIRIHNFIGDIGTDCIGCC